MNRKGEHSPSIQKTIGSTKERKERELTITSEKIRNQLRHVVRGRKEKGQKRESKGSDKVIQRIWLRELDSDNLIHRIWFSEPESKKVILNLFTVPIRVVPTEGWKWPRIRCREAGLSVRQKADQSIAPCRLSARNRKETTQFRAKSHSS